MARVVDELPGGYRGPAYPWEQWLDGRVWELVQGEDFHSAMQSFRNHAFAAAKRRGVKLTTRTIPGEEGAIYLKAIKP